MSDFNRRAAKEVPPHDCLILLPVIDGGTANMAEIKGPEPLQGDQPSGSGIISIQKASLLLLLLLLLTKNITI